MSQHIEFLGREAGRITDQVAHWTPARWRLPCQDDDTRSRADAMTAAVRELAALAAAAEGRPAYPVPAPDNPPVLVDQLRVMVADLRSAGPAPDEVTAARQTLRRLRSAIF